MITRSLPFRPFVLLILLFLLVACGGDPKLLKIDDNPVGEKDETNPSQNGGGISPNQVRGNVIDGPLYNAMVYLDKNSNGKWEDGEPYAITDYNGNYELKAEPEELAKYNLLVDMVADTIDTETKKHPGSYTMTYFSPSVRSELSGNLNSHGFSINAFTSLIQDEIERGVAPVRAVKNIGLLLGLREQNYHLLLVDFWRVKMTGKVGREKVPPEILKIVNRLHNIARVYARVLSKKLNELTAGKSYTTAQKGYITHMILDVLKQKLSGVMSTEENDMRFSESKVEVDILSKEVAQKINTKNIDEMVKEHNFAIPPNRPAITNTEDIFSLAQAKAGIKLSWKMYYGENGGEVILRKMYEDEKVDSKYISADTPNVQAGSFNLKLNKESIYSYKVCLKNNNGESCSADFKFKVIKQAVASVTSGAETTINIFPLLPEGDPKLRPGKPTWNGWMQGVKSSRFVKKGKWYNAAWSKWIGLIADEYTFLRCYDKKSYDSTSNGGYVCDDIKIDKNFAAKAPHTWDHWVDGKIVGKAGGQTAKVATQITMLPDDKLYKLEDGKEKGVFYVHQVKLCRTADGHKHCSVSDPLKLYVTKADGTITVKPKLDSEPIKVKDEGSTGDTTKEMVPVLTTDGGGNSDTGEGAKVDNPAPPGQKEDPALGSSKQGNTADQTPLAVATVNYIPGSWKAFEKETDVDVTITKYYGNVGSHWKIEVYKYGLGAEIDEANLPTATITTTGKTVQNAVPVTVSFSHKFKFSDEGLYAFKGFLCDGDLSKSETFCQPSSNMQIIQVGGVKKPVKITVPDLPSGGNSIAGGKIKYEALTDEEYVRQENAKRSPKLKAAIERIRTLPLTHTSIHLLTYQYINSHINTSTHTSTHTSIHQLIHQLTHQYIYSCINSHVNTSTHTSIHQLIHQLTHQYIYLYINSHINTSTHTSTYTSMHILIHQLTHQYIYSYINLHINTSTHTSTYTSIHLLIHQLTHQYIYSYINLHINTSTHASTHTSIHLLIHQLTHQYIYSYINSHTNTSTQSHISTCQHTQLLVQSSHNRYFYLGRRKL